MTAQQPDEVVFGGHRFAVTAVDGVGLFDPAGYGLEPRPLGTHCYRGYICRYTVTEGRTVLEDLRLGADDEPPRLDGVRPRRDDDHLEWCYEGLDLPAAFTGRLLIGRGDPDDRPYLNMGFWPAWMYQEVHELTVRDGAVLAAVDCSSELAAVRANHAETATRPAPGEPTRDWISRTFSLSYSYSRPGRS
ncbi:hypothetical protein [Streptomyces sp. NPDC096132]|uniref:hypothetical protein n=1 Tax=Streptomyces sp. NPDC096132 TaxID=3366075 RepID=UPI003811D090